MTEELWRFLCLFEQAVVAMETPIKQGGGATADEDGGVASCLRGMRTIKKELATEGLVPNVKEYQAWVEMMIKSDDYHRVCRALGDYCYFEQAVEALDHLPKLRLYLRQAGFPEWAGLAVDRETFRPVALEIVQKIEDTVGQLLQEDEDLGMMLDTMARAAIVYQLSLSLRARAFISWWWHTQSADPLTYQ